jgi:hypothetical protein
MLGSVQIFLLLSDQFRYCDTALQATLFRTKKIVYNFRYGFGSTQMIRLWNNVGMFKIFCHFRIDFGMALIRDTALLAILFRTRKKFLYKFRYRSGSTKMVRLRNNVGSYTVYQCCEAASFLSIEMRLRGPRLHRNEAAPAI